MYTDCGSLVSSSLRITNRVPIWWISMTVNTAVTSIRWVSETWYLRRKCPGSLCYMTHHMPFNVVILWPSWPFHSHYTGMYGLICIQLYFALCVISMHFSFEWIHETNTCRSWNARSDWYLIRCIHSLFPNVRLCNQCTCLCYCSMGLATTNLWCTLQWRLFLMGLWGT